MKKLFLTLLLCLISSCAWAYSCVISNAGGNWNSAGTWTSCNSTFPQTGDDVSATGTSGNLAMNATTAQLNSFDLTGYTGTLSGSGSIHVEPANGTTTTFNFPGTMGGYTWTGTLLVNVKTSTDIGTTINFYSGGHAFGTFGIGNNVTPTGSGTGITVNQRDNFTMTSGSFQLSNGTWNTNNYSLNVTEITSTTSGRSSVFNWGTSSITATSTNPFIVTGTQLSFDSPLSINCTNTGVIQFYGGGLTYNNVTFTGGGTINFLGANTFTNLQVSGVTTLVFPASVTQTFTSQSSGFNNGTNLLTIQSTTPGTAATFSKSGGGSVKVDYVSLSDNIASPANTWKYGINSLVVGTNVSGWMYPSWGMPSWKYRQKITIDHTKVGATTEDETNFPVEISLTGLSNINTAGSDIRFTIYDGLTPIAREIESYSSGILVAWVKVTLSYTADTVIYMYYGNSGATEPAANSTYGSQSVWDTYYSAVYHVATSNTYNDSTSYGNNVSNTGFTTTTGKIDGGVNASEGYATKVTPTNLYFTTSDYITIEAWVKRTATTATNYESITSNYSGVGNRQFEFDFNKQAVGEPVYNAITFHFFAGTYPSGTWQSYCHNSADTDTTAFHHYVFSFIYGTPGSAALYVDGSSAAGTWTNTGNGVPSTSTYGFMIGGTDAGGSGEFVNGTMDEIRVSKGIQRSAGWISTEYNNQNSPSTFYSNAFQIQNAGFFIKH